MRISGTEPSSVFRSQKGRGCVKGWKVMIQKCQKQAVAKRGGLKTIKITISINFDTENFDALKTLRINRSRSESLATCARGDHMDHMRISGTEPSSVILLMTF